MILDVFSRYIVGWTVAYHENAQIATALIEPAAEQQQITPKILTLHADRGAPQRAKPVAFLLADFGVGSHCTSLGQSLTSRSTAASETLILRPFR